jgi:hypothetical protein
MSEPLATAAWRFAVHVSAVMCDHGGAVGGTHTSCPERLALDAALAESRRSDDEWEPSPNLGATAWQRRSVRYELWDVSSGNIVDSLASLTELARSAFALGQANPDEPVEDMSARAVFDAPAEPVMSVAMSDADEGSA